MKNEYIVSDFEIVENKYFGINTGKLINDFLRYINIFKIILDLVIVN